MQQLQPGQDTQSAALCLLGLQARHSTPCTRASSPHSNCKQQSPQPPMASRLSGLTRKLARRPSLQEATLLQVFRAGLEAQTEDSNRAAPADNPAIVDSSGASPAHPYQRKGTGLSRRALSRSKQDSGRMVTLQPARKPAQESDHATPDVMGEPAAVCDLQARLQQVNAHPNTAVASLPPLGPSTAAAAAASSGQRKSSRLQQCDTAEAGGFAVAAAQLDAKPAAQSAQRQRSLAQRQKRGSGSVANSRHQASLPPGMTPSSQAASAQQLLQPTSPVSSIHPASNFGDMLSQQPAAAHRPPHLPHPAPAANPAGFKLPQPLNAADMTVSEPLEQDPAVASVVTDSVQTLAPGWDWKSFLQSCSQQLRGNWNDLSEELDLVYNQLPDGSTPGELDWSGSSCVASKPFNQVCKAVTWMHREQVTCFDHAVFDHEYRSCSLVAHATPL